MIQMNLLRMTLIILLTAGIAGFFGCNEMQVRKKREVRAVWMTRFEYAQGKTKAESQKFIYDSFRKFSQAGVNTIVFQVRGNADAFYVSEFEPWSMLLSGTLGKDPEWDPLAFALETARPLGLEVHAWLNTFPAWRHNDPPPEMSQPEHPLRLHPEWLVCDSAGTAMQTGEGYISFSPGNPEVHEHILKVVMDILNKYDVDGIHFDYIRYPENSLAKGYSHDKVSINRFNSIKGNPLSLEWENWQREQVNNFISGIYNHVTKAKPWVKISAAVLGFHHRAGWSGYFPVYQDARRWIASGKIDMLFPMMYTKIGHPTAPFEEALQQWKSMSYLGRPIFPGIGSYQVGRRYKWSDVWDQISLIRKEKFNGMIFFAASSLLEGLQQISEKYYPSPALTLAMPWKANVPVVFPRIKNVVLNIDTLEIHFDKQETVSQYVVYKSPDFENADNIVAIIPGVIEMKKIKISENYLSTPIAVTALNRIGVESEPVWINYGSGKQISINQNSNPGEKGTE